MLYRGDIGIMDKKMETTIVYVLYMSLEDFCALAPGIHTARTQNIGS